MISKGVLEIPWGIGFPIPYGISNGGTLFPAGEAVYYYSILTSPPFQSVIDLLEEGGVIIMAGTVDCSNVYCLICTGHHRDNHNILVIMIKNVTQCDACVFLDKYQDAPLFR